MSRGGSPPSIDRPPMCGDMLPSGLASEEEICQRLTIGLYKRVFFDRMVIIEMEEAKAFSGKQTRTLATKTFSLSKTCPLMLLNPLNMFITHMRLFGKKLDRRSCQDSCDQAGFVPCPPVFKPSCSLARRQCRAVEHCPTDYGRHLLEPRAILLHADSERSSCEVSNLRLLCASVPWPSGTLMHR